MTTTDKTSGLDSKQLLGWSEFTKLDDTITPNTGDLGKLLSKRGFETVNESDLGKLLSKRSTEV